MTDLSAQLVLQALQARREHRLADARRDLEQALALRRQGSSESELAETLTHLGQIERDLHHPDAALAHYEEALSLYRTSGDSLRVAHTVRHVGDLHRHASRLPASEACYLEALTLYRVNEAAPPLDLANAIRGFALLKEDAGEPEPAKSLWQEARDLYSAVGVRAGVEECSRRLAQLSS
jgi:tetratricopeptide (TPR) repeat protein